MASASDVCLNESLDDNNSFLDMELEALQSIYINELKVQKDEKSTTVSIDLYPATADKLEQQYVRLTLEFNLEEEYPEKLPEIKIRNPRGLSDEMLNNITEDLSVIAESKKGNSMLFEMIDAAKEHLTIGNRPSGNCGICLFGFSPNDMFTRTECYHYFHSHCLSRFAKHFSENVPECEVDHSKTQITNELLCPMCRVPIEFDDVDADFPPPEESVEIDDALTDEVRELQKKMADLYQKQYEKGGIIDIETERRKFLLEISRMQPPRDEDTAEEIIVADTDSATSSSRVEVTEEIESTVTDRKDNFREQNQKFNYRGKNRNFNKPNDNRSNYRYNKQSYDNYRGNFNKNRYGRQIPGRFQRSRNDFVSSQDRSCDSSVPQNFVKGELLACSHSVEDVSEVSEQPSSESRSTHTPNFSPRYSRGYRQGRTNRGNYNSQQSGKSNFHEHRNPQSSRRYNAIRDEESSPGHSNGRPDDDLGTAADDNTQTRRFKSGNFRHDDGDYARQRYSDRNNSQRNFRGAYRRNNYSNPNNYPKNNRYGDSRDREQYSERYHQDRRTYRDDKPKGTHNYDKHRQGARYSGNRPGRYSDRSYAESSNNESESLDYSSQNHNSDSNALSVKNEVSRDSVHQPRSSAKEDKPSHKVDSVSVDDKGSGALSGMAQCIEGNASSSSFPNAVCENPRAPSKAVKPPPGFANPLKKVIYGLQGANPPPGFNKS